VRLRCTGHRARRCLLSTLDVQGLAVRFVSWFTQAQGNCHGPQSQTDDNRLSRNFAQSTDTTYDNTIGRPPLTKLNMLLNDERPPLQERRAGADEVGHCPGTLTCPRPEPKLSISKVVLQHHA
jgi:hypothetical protein